MSDSIKVLDPRTLVTLQSGDEITVREFTWREAYDFMGKLSDHISKFVTEKGELSFDFGKVSQVIMSSEELSAFMVTKSTGRNAEWLNGLPMRDGVKVLGASLELNINDELIGDAKKHGARLGELFGVKKKLDAQPLPK